MEKKINGFNRYKLECKYCHKSKHPKLMFTLGITCNKYVCSMCLRERITQLKPDPSQIRILEEVEKHSKESYKCAECDDSDTIYATFDGKYVYLCEKHFNAHSNTNNLLFYEFP